MIRIQFKVLSFQDADFINTVNEEGFLEPSPEISIPISTDWDGEVFPVQYLTYNSYTFNVTMRDSEYQRFMQIQYAPSVIISVGSENLTCKVETFSPEKYLNEFWKINVIVSVLNTRKVENIIRNTIKDVLNITQVKAPVILISVNVNLDAFTDVKFVQVLADDFSDRVSDYNKVSETRNVRFFLLTSEALDFFAEIDKVGLFSTEKISFEGFTYNEFELITEKVGYDLFQITIILYTENRITVPGT